MNNLPKFALSASLLVASFPHCCPADTNQTGIQKPFAMFQISAGGEWTQNYTADVGTNGVSIGSGTMTRSAAFALIDTSRDLEAAPESVYRSERYGAVVRYAFSGLKPGGLYNVRLHFSVPAGQAAKNRTFDVLLTDDVTSGATARRTVLHHFNPYREAGGPNRAILKAMQTHADACGMIRIVGTSLDPGDMGVASFNAIEVVPTDLPEAVPTAALNVRDFGAKADGVTDDAPAFQSAIAAAVSKGAGAVLLIPAGTYFVRTPIKIEHTDHLTIRGQGAAVLQATDDHTDLLHLNHNDGLIIGHLTIAYPLGYTQGKIQTVDVAGKTVDVSIDDSYPNLDSLLFTNPANDRIHPFTHPESHTYEQDVQEPDTTSLHQTGARTWHLTLNLPPARAWIGKQFLIANLNGAVALSGNGNRDTIIEDLAVHGGGVITPYFFTQTSGVFTFRHFVISGRPGKEDLAGSSGGGQFASYRGTLVYENCDFSQGDDDGADIRADQYQRVVQQLSSTVIKVQRHADFQTGDRISLVDWTTFSQRSQPKVVSVVNNSDATCTLTLDRPVSIERQGVGDSKPMYTVALHDGIDRVIDLDDAGKLTVFRHNRMSELRARPIDTKAQNCIIEDNYFHDCEIFAIEAGPEFFWEEGPTIHGLTVMHNQFYNCDEANIRVGLFDAPGVYTNTDNEHIAVINNRFWGYGAYPNAYSNPQGAVAISNAIGVDIEGNDFGPPAPTAVPGLKKLLITHCAQVTIKNNKGLNAADGQMKDLTGQAPWYQKDRIKP